MNESSYPDQQLARGQEATVGPRPENGAGLPTSILNPFARAISITPLNHGFHVNVGCQNFAIKSIDALLHRLSVYLKNPVEAEKRWMTGEWKW